VTMPDLKDIYTRQAGRYDELVTHEDYQQNLLAAINRVRPVAGLDVVELGAGTGRLTCRLAPLVKTVRAFDTSPAMLAVAAAKLYCGGSVKLPPGGGAAKLQRGGAANWQVRVADHRRLPVADGTADLALAGWTLCYAALDHPDRWRQTVAQAVGEMQRVLRPGGTCLIIETQGTGFETPHPPDVLKDYLDYLTELGFQSEWIRTDYQFASLAEAEELMRFFFGEALAAQTVREQWQIVPECTGLWWR
jgi:ubiquinone/menaquinone biosynthesis C-methylase UbiE